MRSVRCSPTSRTCVGGCSPSRPAQARSDVIVRKGLGYAVRQPVEAVDAWRFEGLLERADRAVRPEEVTSLLREAVELWKGPALVDYADEPWAAAESARLTELRTVARERAARRSGPRPTCEGHVAPWRRCAPDPMRPLASTFHLVGQ